MEELGCMEAGPSALVHRKEAMKFRRLAESEEGPVKRVLEEIARLHDLIADRLDALNRGQ
jgi:hypothetical protein